MIIPRLGSSDESDEVRILAEDSRDGCQEGEALLEVETDKVNVKIEAPDDGVVNGMSAREGDFVKFGSVVAIIDRES